MEVYSVDLKVRYRKNPEDHIEQILENWGFEVLACEVTEEPKDAKPRGTLPSYLGKTSEDLLPHFKRNKRQK